VIGALNLCVGFFAEEDADEAQGEAEERPISWFYNGQEALEKLGNVAKAPFC
jgi:hypothetical protein